MRKNEGKRTGKALGLPEKHNKTAGLHRRSYETKGGLTVDFWIVRSVEHCGAHDDAANALVCEMEQCREGLWPQLGESQREQVQGYLDRMEHGGPPVAITGGFAMLMQKTCTGQGNGAGKQ